MEKRFDMMDFEESLRDHADRFTLMPTKKVWVGLYNGLHPGSKWPSITMGFLLVLSIIIVGNLNNTNKTTQSALPVDSNYAVNQNEIFLNNERRNNNLVKTINDGSFETAPINTLQSSSKKNEELIDRKNLTLKSSDYSTITSETAFENKNLEKTNSFSKYTDADGIKSIKKDNLFVPNISESDLEMLLPRLEKNMLPFEKSLVDGNFVETFQNINPFVRIDNNLLLGRQEDNNFDDNVTEQKLRVKKNHKSSWSFYLSPSISSALFTGAPISQSSVSYSSPLMINAGNVSVNRKYGGRLSISAGAVSSLPINGKLNFTSGLMLTYLGYKTTSSAIHPTFANLMLKDKTGSAYLSSYITHYGNGSGFGQLQLNNYSYQFAVPIGLQYTLFENQQLNWKIGSSIAPSVVLASQSYILSANGRNYITDPDLLRRFNLLANFETFVTLKTAKIKWQIGPSFGYQTFSTFKKSYTEKEHLLDYGIKIGVSR